MWRPWVSLHLTSQPRPQKAESSSTGINITISHRVFNDCGRKAVVNELWGVKALYLFIISWRNSKQNCVPHFILSSFNITSFLHWLPLHNLPSNDGRDNLFAWWILLHCFEKLIAAATCHLCTLLMSLAVSAEACFLSCCLAWSKLEQSTVCMLQQYCYALYPAEWAALEL